MSCLFRLTSPVIFTDSAVAVDDAVAGNEHGHGVLGDGGGYGTHSLWFADALGDLLIGGGGAEWDVLQLMPYL